MELKLGPDPEAIYPIKTHSKLIFLKNFVKSKNIIIGDYTYYADLANGAEDFEERNVLYNKEKVKLIIGKFCAIAAGTRFLLTGNHKLDAISTYPFPLFGDLWDHPYNFFDLPVKGDIVVGNDVWFGYDSIIGNGVKIGNGAIIGTRAVVVKEVPAYSIVGGNPAKVVKMRFDDNTIERLQKIAWWDWSIEKISRNLKVISSLDIDRLEAASVED